MRKWSAYPGRADSTDCIAYFYHNPSGHGLTSPPSIRMTATLEVEKVKCDPVPSSLILKNSTRDMRQIDCATLTPKRWMLGPVSFPYRSIDGSASSPGEFTQIIQLREQSCSQIAKLEMEGALVDGEEGLR